MRSPIADIRRVERARGSVAADLAASQIKQAILNILASEPPKREKEQLERFVIKIDKYLSDDESTTNVKRNLKKEAQLRKLREKEADNRVIYIVSKGLLNDRLPARLSNGISSIGAN